MIAKNKLTDSIPTQIGLLANLITTTNLGRRLFYVKPSVTFIKRQIINLMFPSKSFFLSNVMVDNELTDSIPIEVGSLTTLDDLKFGKKLSSVLPLYFETRQTCSMLLTIYLSLSLSISLSLFDFLSNYCDSWEWTNRFNSNTSWFIDQPLFTFFGYKIVFCFTIIYFKTKHICSKLLTFFYPFCFIANNNFK